MKRVRSETKLANSQRKTISTMKLHVQLCVVQGLTVLFRLHVAKLSIYQSKPIIP